MAGSQPIAKVWRLKLNLVDLLAVSIAFMVHQRLHGVICQASKNRPTWRAVRKTIRVDMSWNVALPCRIFFQKCFSLKSLNLVDRELSKSEAPHLLLQTCLLTLFTFYFLPISWNQKLLVTSGLEIEKVKPMISNVLFSCPSCRFAGIVNPWAEKDRMKAWKWTGRTFLHQADRPAMLSTSSFDSPFLMVDFCRTFPSSSLIKLASLRQLCGAHVARMMLMEHVENRRCPQTR